MSEAICTLYVNDTPREGSPGAMTYDAAKQHVVAVSFEAADGTAMRANFDPETGAVTTQRLPPPPNEDRTEGAG